MPGRKLNVSERLTCLITNMFATTATSVSGTRCAAHERAVVVELHDARLADAAVGRARRLGYLAGGAHGAGLVAVGVDVGVRAKSREQLVGAADGCHREVVLLASCSSYAAGGN